jgi:hypothetical protein
VLLLVSSGFNCLLSELNSSKRMTKDMFTFPSLASMKAYSIVTNWYFLCNQQCGVIFLVTIVIRMLDTLGFLEDFPTILVTDLRFVTKIKIIIFDT